MPNTESVLRLLEELERGSAEPRVFDELFSLVYDELRTLARRQRRRSPGRETLNTTALVHEAYLKLAARPDATWQSKAHFLAAASRAIRHILLNYARDQRAEKRGGGWLRLSLHGDAAPLSTGTDAAGRELLIALDDALHALSRFSERMARIVECRFFGGMSIEETAVALSVSTATVTRGWATAQAWLHRELDGQAGATLG